VHKAFKASPEPRGNPDRKDPKDHKALRERRAPKAKWASPRPTFAPFGVMAHFFIV
jgi:hypothetical protein